MSFKKWFKRWVRSFYRLLMIGSKPYKSDKQRKKEHKRRMKAKYARHDPFKKKRRYKRHRGSGYAKALAAIMDFSVTSLAFLFLPFGLLHWGYKSAQTHRRAKKIAKAKASAKKSHRSSPAPQKTNRATANKIQSQQNSPTVITQASTKPKATETKVKPSVTSTRVQTDKEPVNVSHTPTASHQIDKPVVIPPTPPAPVPEIKVLDETTPKSSPKNEADRYIRKRMIIAGSSYCEPSVLAKLQIGTYFDLSREPENPYDRDAVVLTYEGEKIGYVSKQDAPPFTVSLNLRRKMYGVITDIIAEGNRTKYEYETWFSSEK